ncbi:MAG: hypothetical protein DELT_03072 [Desulfovibrio sp.]
MRIWSGCMANKTVIDLLEDFSFRHAKIDQENERRMKNDAEIMKLEEQKRALLAEKLKRAFLAEDAAGFDGEIAELGRRQDEIARAKGLLIPYACPACRDTGLVGRKYCACFLREVYQSIYGAADVDALTESFERADMSVFDGEKELAMGKTQRALAELAYGICKKYVDAFPDTPRLNLLLRGKAGLGKSYLLRCVASAAKKRGIDVCLIRAGELFGAFFRHRMGEEMPLSFLQDAQLLLVDDLGTEPMTQNVTTEYLFDLLNRRLEAGRHTAVATNVDDLQGRYGERISSRLESRECAVLMLDGTDLRLRR